MTLNSCSHHCLHMMLMLSMGLCWWWRTFQPVGHWSLFPCHRCTVHHQSIDVQSVRLEDEGICVASQWRRTYVIFSAISISGIRTVVKTIVLHTSVYTRTPVQTNHGRSPIRVRLSFSRFRRPWRKRRTFVGNDRIRLRLLQVLGYSLGDFFGATQWD